MKGTIELTDINIDVISELSSTPIKLEMIYSNGKKDSAFITSGEYDFGSGITTLEFEGFEA